MKNKWCFIMGILSCILSLFGCTQKPARPVGELTSISISQSHMDSTYCYSFCARVENNSCLLDAECFIVDYDNNECEEINLTDTPISEEDFNKFSALDKQYDFYSHLKPVEKEKSKIFVCDETITSFYVRYGEAGFGVKTSGEPYEAVNQCFFELAQKYNNENNKYE